MKPNVCWQLFQTKSSVNRHYCQIWSYHFGSSISLTVKILQSNRCIFLKIGKKNVWKNLTNDRKMLSRDTAVSTQFSLFTDTTWWLQSPNVQTKCRSSCRSSVNVWCFVWQRTQGADLETLWTEMSVKWADTKRLQNIPVAMSIWIEHFGYASLVSHFFVNR